MVGSSQKEFIIYEKEPSLKGVIKSFYNAKKIVKKAVDDVSFTIQQGEIVGYIGPNGVGKSTTDALQGLLILAIWVGIFNLFSNLTFKLSMKKIVVFGG